jgi:hypothetical protein
MKMCPRTRNNIHRPFSNVATPHHNGGGALFIYPTGQVQVSLYAPLPATVPKPHGGTSAEGFSNSKEAASVVEAGLRTCVSG